MQTKELETLHHAPLDPRQQRSETCLSGFIKSPLSIFRQTAMLPITMLLEDVMAS
jgi:hypothetical protein